MQINYMRPENKALFILIYNNSYTLWLFENLENILLIIIFLLDFM